MTTKLQTTIFSVLAASAVFAASVPKERITSLDGEWDFSKNGGAWEKVEVPHDWAIASPFKRDGDGNTGKLPWRAKGVYKRKFMCSVPPNGGAVRLEFDGVMARPEVFVNGVKAGGWDYGYVSFDCDISGIVKNGENELEVRADTRGHGSRWYPGGGIYRSVRLVECAPGYTLPGTVFITTPEVTSESATVKVEWETKAGKHHKTFKVKNPKLWSPETPHLYSVEVNGMKYRYGIRSFKWTANDGFHLNGKRYQIKGANLHSDFGPLGRAFYKGAARRQLEIMRDMGVNAIRTSHNPQAPEFLDLCDEMGFLVWNECFDKWNNASSRRKDENLEEYISRNLKAFVRRDRNHPCVVCWSISNEIRAASDSYPDGQTKERVTAFAAAVRSVDPTRPVASGNCKPMGFPDKSIFAALDLTGWNYARAYAAQHEYNPKTQAVVISESASTVSSRDWYGDAPPANKLDFDFAANEVSSYDSCAAQWSDIPDVEFHRLEKDRYCAGEFVWSGFDYLGEPYPFEWQINKVPREKQSRSSFFGCVDLTGVPKDRYWLYRSQWNTKSHTCHIAAPPPPAKTVFVYTDGDEAELFLNGRSLGKKRKLKDVDYPLDFIRKWPKAVSCEKNPYYAVCDKYRLRWFNVPKESGELVAVAYKNGKEIGRDILKTPGVPERLVVESENERDGLLFFHVKMVDAKGVFVPSAQNRVKFSLKGPGKIIAVGNGDANGYDSFKEVSSHPLYNGRALAIVERKGSGEITLDATMATPLPETVFRNPPQEAKTGVMWMWMGSNVTKEGIVKDLDWFADTGIGAAIIFALADICTPPATEIYDCPTGKLLAFTPKWWKFLKFACEEAEKRGIELGLHQTPGYSSTGGPWIPPHLAMRELVFNVTNVEEQISITAHANHPVRNPQTERPEKPNKPCRRTDLREIAVVDGVRVQHIPMGAFNQPAQWELLGLECDKMNPEAVAFHIDHVIGEIKKNLGEQVGRGLKFLHLDSYEAGKPTWTPRMREEFMARRGYDPLPFLPVLGGFKTKAAPDKASEKKFKDDYMRTIKDLYRDVLFKTLHEKINAAGLEFSCEPYGGPIVSKECAVYVDRLMMEFWLDSKRDRNIPKPLGWNKWKGPGGKRHNIIYAEAFSGAPQYASWTETPSQLKARVDTEFDRGVNRMICHTCPLQPWSDEFKPGKTMGRWGTHIGRTQTWAKSGKGIFTYMNRCQALLQWGELSEKRMKKISVVPAKTPVTARAREADGRILFFAVNHSGHPVTAEMTLPEKNVFARWFNPVSGAITPLEVTDGKVTVSLSACGSGFIELSPANGKKAVRKDKCPVQVAMCKVKVSKPWKVTFGDLEIDMPKLKDWTTFDESQIKYFSGTAKYRTAFTGIASSISLGDCNGQVARVIVNGRDCGTAWCDPYEVEIPEGVSIVGENTLEIEFTNVWANRLIGDEQEPPDCDFAFAPQKPRGYWYLRRFPAWFKTGIASRPSKGRKCFTDWNYFKKDSPLVPSGLIGPVELVKKEKTK